MSLFPAYDTATETNEATQPKASTSSEWLENNSFAIKVEQLNAALGEVCAEISDESNERVPSPKNPEKKHEHKKKRRKKDKQEARKQLPEKVIEFLGDEDYYVDKAPAVQYRTIQTLHKPARPRYYSHFRRKLGWKYSITSYFEGSEQSIKRYYRERQKKNAATITESNAALDENEYTLLLGQLNRKIMESPGEIQVWRELIQLQERNPYKWSRLMLAERKLDLVQRALSYHTRNEYLYRVYIDTINSTYPAFEVSKMLDRMLAKDPYNYTLWTAQIMATQGSMARCVVPDVLRIYERCMQKMHHSQNTVGKADAVGNCSDEVMLKLFNNCALFLRQAGLYEQFFALVKLALELNVSTELFGDFAPMESDQRTLIEYEELILQSGLPMNEIWLRIEKLRQGYNFLPCPQNAKCSDPQRIVFNEDVCHYIYPLKERENSFYLMLLVLRLMKVPFVQCDNLSGKFCARVEHIGDSDAIEDVLAACLHRTYALPLKQQDDFLSSLYELSREMAVSPSFLSSNLGYEIYTNCVTQMLMNCAAAQSGIDDQKRIIFILMWCRFERLQIVLQKYSKKLNADSVKAGRNRFKVLLKQASNQNILMFYIEYALYELEASSPLTVADLKPVISIFEKVLLSHTVDSPPLVSAELCYAYVTLAEIFIGYGEREEAMQVLVACVLGIDNKTKGIISEANKLCALTKLTEKLNGIIAVELNVETMVLEQYLLPDITVGLIKLRTLLQYTISRNGKMEAMAYLEHLLKYFPRGDTDRHRFLREHIHELHAIVMQLPCENCVCSNAAIGNKVFPALEEFPRNLFLLQCCGMLTTIPWYKIRAAMMQTKSSPTMVAITFLIATARFRFLQSNAASKMFPINGNTATATCDQRHAEMIVRNRILSIFKALTPDSSADTKTQNQYNVLQRNALFWRFYLRCLSDQSTAFETSRKCLLTALDECPWSKALYLDGATYVPQELSHLQDLLIEKQLRICALPEELDILREH